MSGRPFFGRLPGETLQEWKRRTDAERDEWHQIRARDRQRTVNIDEIFQRLDKLEKKVFAKNLQGKKRKL